MRKLSVGLAILLMIAYALGLLFSLKTHKELFASEERAEDERNTGRSGLRAAHCSSSPY